MSNINYKIISTGSRGNATLIEGCILIDCGVPIKALTCSWKAIKLVLLTHIHGDHLNKATIRKLAFERPTLRFGCGEWLVQTLIDCGVSRHNIDVMKDGKSYNYGICKVIPVELSHNVKNMGYKIHFSHGKMIYATDTNNLNGISAENYDLYLIEANYEDEEIHERIKEKRAAGEYAYETQVLKNHLSKSKADEFIYRNITHGDFEYMHIHGDTRTYKRGG